MTAVFQIVIGSITYDLNGAGNVLSEYNQAYGDGVKPVTESAVVIMVGSTVDNLLAAISNLQRTRLSAVRRQTINAGDRVFLKYRPNGATTTYRSEILTLKAEPVADSLWGRPSGFDNRKVKYVIAFTRVGFWEYDTLTQIPLTNGNATADTAGLKVYANNDGTGAAGSVRHNYVQMAAADVLGEMACPVYLEYSNTFGAAMRRLYVAHKAQGVPATFVHILEAEDATPGTGVTSTVDADCSGGDKAAVVDVPATARTLCTWTLTTAQAITILSQWVKILARFEDLPSNATCSVRFVVQESVTTAQIGASAWVTLSAADYLQQIGTLMLSPNLQGQATAGAIKLLLQAKDSAAACDFGLDFIQLSPCEGGQGFRKIYAIDEALVSVPATTGVLVDNMIDEAGPYIESQQPVWLADGRIELVPNTINRLYFLRDQADASAAVAAVMTVKAWHRPRIAVLG